MFTKTQYIWAALAVLIFISACNSTDSKKESSASTKENAGKEKTSSNNKKDADILDDVSGDESKRDASAADDATVTGEGPRCGDGITQADLNEICDDGNLNDYDGCTSLCEYTCTEDDHCDDKNSCNGEETCNDSFYCDVGAYLEDGVNCGLKQSCYSGLCLNDVCGDSEQQGDEECDDGDTIDDNGCTRDCHYSCKNDEDCIEGGDSCASNLTCDTKTHTCTGEPKKDQSSCKMLDSNQSGWCIKGVCVPEKCGDGEIDTDRGEDCDLGQQNGETGSPCSLSCQTTICGNGKIEESEQCDDGNTDNYDSCSSECQVESWVRWTSMHLLKEPSPDFCVHKGKNQLSNAFPGAIRIPLTDEEIDVLSLLNDLLGMALDNCSSNSINLFHGSNDTSYTSTDDEIFLTLFEGELEAGETCEPPMEVDTQFKIVSSDTDISSAPITKVTAAQRPGVIKTLEPADIRTQIPGMGAIILHDLMLLVEVDTENLTTPASPPETAETVKMPERMGFGDPDLSPYHPAGRLCGAVGAASMEDQGVDADSQLASCCKADGTTYDECQEGDVPGKDCDTFLDVMKEGCILCDITSVLSTGEAVCNDCDSFSLEIIRPTPPDIDTDDDGTADAYSVVIGIEGERIRVTGFQTPEE